MLIRNHKANGSRGFTLTEAAIVLGIVGLILGAIWSAAAAVYRNQRVSQTSNQVIQIVNAVRALHATSAVVDATTTMATLINAGVIPRDMVNGVTAQNLWGGGVTFARATCNAGAAGNCFTLTFAIVPREACIDLLARTAGPGRDTGLNAAGAGGANIGALPATVATASAICGAAAAGTTSVNFTFMLKG